MGVRSHYSGDITVAIKIKHSGARNILLRKREPVRRSTDSHELPAQSLSDLSHRVGHRNRFFFLLILSSFDVAPGSGALSRCGQSPGSPWCTYSWTGCLPNWRWSHWSAQLRNDRVSRPPPVLHYLGGARAATGITVLSAPSISSVPFSELRPSQGLVSSPQCADSQVPDLRLICARGRNACQLRRVRHDYL